MSLQTKLQGLVDGKTAVVNSINAKASTSLTVTSKWSDLASAVDGITAGGGGAEIEPIVLTGNCEKACANAFATAFLTIAPEKVSTSNVTGASSMFANSTLTKIPFDINFDIRSATSDGQSTISMFSNCHNLTELPKMINLKPHSMDSMFQYCFSLREIPEDLDDTWDWSAKTKNDQYTLRMANMVSQCYSLRTLPYFIFENANPQTYYSFTYLNGLAYSCYALDEIVNLPLPFTASFPGNAFGDAFRGAGRVKNITFALNPETNQPYVMNWQSQDIKLNYYCGWAQYGNVISNYNSGITADKRVTDDASYQALKNDPDWWTTKVEYSRYNHDSAVATINSLPDTSAYLSSLGTTATNRIRFKRDAGANTDGGAISTLTEEEIAVATAKGWTVMIEA